MNNDTDKSRVKVPALSPDPNMKYDAEELQLELMALEVTHKVHWYKFLHQALIPIVGFTLIILLSLLFCGGILGLVALAKSVI